MKIAAAGKSANFFQFSAAFTLLLLASLLLPVDLFGQKRAEPAAATAAAVAADEALILGNPSKAKTDLNQPDNYLVVHSGYTLSYNRSRGAANWVAWHLEKADVGSAERTNAFAPDTTLPQDWWIRPNDYTGSGYDRGHLCPSKDRSASEEINRVTFLMSNMQPQAPKLNQKTWKYLEDYTRETVRDGEAYVYAGCYGNAGRLKNKVTIPTNCWKIVVVLKEGDNDLKRIDNKTRIIAVDMPNDETVSQRWRTYLTTVDEIEKRTGYDFLSTVAKKTQSQIESRKDAEAETKSSEGKTPETTSTGGKPVDGKTDEPKKAGGRTYVLGPRGGCYYVSESGKKIYVADKSLCGN